MTVLSLCACLLLLGCGSGEDSSGGSGGSGEPESGFEDADPEAVEVIRDWSDTLSSGDTEGAAEFFAIPSVAENGPTIQIRSRADAVAFNEALPCGAELTEAETVGEFTTATFRLSDRPGGSCGSGIGGEASTSFVIADGKITEWRRVGVEPPGDGAEQSPSRTT